MTLIIIQDLKIPKNSIETKTKRFQYDLEEKGKFPRFPSSRFCSIPEIENSEISENSLLIQILTGQNLKGCVMVEKEKTKTYEFLILAYNQNRKLGNLGKFCFMYLIIYNFI